MQHEINQALQHWHKISDEHKEAIYKICFGEIPGLSPKIEGLRDVDIYRIIKFHSPEIYLSYKSHTFEDLENNEDFLQYLQTNTELPIKHSDLKFIVQSIKYYLK